MSTTPAFQPGTLVHVRGREWVVQPSANADLMLLRPLGGSEEETTGIYLPLEFPEDIPVSADFPRPSLDDLGGFANARTLHDAARLSFRNGAGPFRCLAKLSFRPRSYQMVPLIMALKQEVIRLLIADDVGVGKTIEALLIIKEMLERRLVPRFAVICLPHLCDQWQQEIRDKIGIEAVVIRSNTQAKLDREIQGDTSVFQHYPFQIISIDYIKSDRRRDTFVAECPELTIVDEAHACARPEGASDNQQQRYALLKKISERENQHLVMLTATPHSGKPGQFHSLLGLLRPEFEDTAITDPSVTTQQRQNERRKVARHFVQRRRADVERWMNEDTPFPQREPGEYNYDLHPDYNQLFEEIWDFCRQLITGEDRIKKVHYWTALGLLRGVMSSPAAGISMLRNRREKIVTEEELEEFPGNPVGDNAEDFESDNTPKELVEATDWNWRQIEQLKSFEDSMAKLSNPTKDEKLLAAQTIIESWLAEGFQPVIFCRYIATAKYVGEQLQKLLSKTKPTKLRKTRVEVVTSEDPDEIRRERIEAMADADLRVLVATDCLSEGINLHQLFTAVLHYDLPWNPNRLEQREGRVDRFGQTAPKVRTWMLFSQNNPVDGVVLNVILRKVIEIKKATGINIPFPEDSQGVIDTITESLLVDSEKRLKSHKKENQIEFSFEEFDEAARIDQRVTDQFGRAKERETAIRSIFAQNAIRAGEIEKDLAENDRAIGDPQAVENFTLAAVQLLGGQIVETEADPGISQAVPVRSYRLHHANLPKALLEQLPKTKKDFHEVTFQSPSPRELVYLGRNHYFVEQLCQTILSQTMERGRYAAARAAVLRTDAVSKPTTLYLLRARNVIHEKTRPAHQHVAEEMLLWGYRGSPENQDHLSPDECYELLFCATPSTDLSPQRRQRALGRALEHLDSLNEELDQLALTRAQNLVEAHERFAEYLKEKRFAVVQPVLPMDILGIYHLLPA